MGAFSTTRTIAGTLIMGTDGGCGKTAVIAGLSGALKESGFGTQAYKPLAFAPEVSLTGKQDQAYLNKVTQQYIQQDTLTLPSPHEMTVPLWNKMLETCKSFPYPCLLEGPGQVATPWHVQGRTLTDGLNIAQELGIPILLVGRAEPVFLEKTRSACTFLQSRHATVLGFILAHTQPDVGTYTTDAMLLCQYYQIPFLGELPYSPSVSVPTLQQGNLIRLVQDNIDLLPLQMGIGLTLA